MKSKFNPHTLGRGESYGFRLAVALALALTVATIGGCGGGGGGGGASVTVTDGTPPPSGLPSYVTTMQAAALTNGLDTAVCVYDGDPTAGTCRVRVDTKAVTGASSYRYVLKTPGQADVVLDTPNTWLDLVEPVNKRFTLDITAGSVTRLSEAFWTTAQKYPMVLHARWKVAQTAPALLDAPVLLTIIGGMSTVAGAAGVKMAAATADGQSFRLWTAANASTATGWDGNGQFPAQTNGFFDRFGPGDGKIPGDGNLFGDKLEVTLNWVLPTYRFTGVVDPTTKFDSSGFNNARNLWWVVGDGGTVAARTAP